jgi:TPR repeat protein
MGSKVSYWPLLALLIVGCQSEDAPVPQLEPTAASDSEEDLAAPALEEPSQPPTESSVTALQMAGNEPTEFVRHLATECDAGSARHCWILGGVSEMGHAGMEAREDYQQSLFRRACTADAIDGCNDATAGGFGGSLASHQPEARDVLRACELGWGAACERLIEGDEIAIDIAPSPGDADRRRADLIRVQELACSAGAIEHCAQLQEGVGDVTPNPDAASEAARLPATAAPMVQEAASRCDAGTATMCVFLAMRYAFDDISGSLATDRAHARELSDRACNDRTAVGCSMAGTLVLDGEAPTETQLAEAIVYFRRGCDRGAHESCAELAQIHEKAGTPEDLLEAATLYYAAWLLDRRDSDSLDAALRLVDAQG